MLVSESIESFLIDNIDMRIDTETDKNQLYSTAFAVFQYQKISNNSTTREIKKIQKLKFKGLFYEGPCSQTVKWNFQHNIVYYIIHIIMCI